MADQSMEKSKLELDRCILFPRTREAVSAIENGVLDSRFEVEVIDLDYSSLSKLRLFGFFSYPKESGLSVTKNSFIKISSVEVELAVETALKSRKETNDRLLTKLIDSFVEKAKRSIRQELPIWFNT
ncbi:hypothetical protein [Pleionea sediminis]|uniref:hypothetical protein n=1 Tax=Pleionea sediminis TaxID=2569479 RepID=UPI001185BDA2|nr:hypothetical protein [Pleionea sediminis]